MSTAVTPVSSGEAAPVVFAGRHAGAVATPADGVSVFDDTMLPRELWPQLDHAAAVVILETLAFPYEALRRQDVDVPLALVLPLGLSAGDLHPVLGDVFANLTVVDRVGVTDESLWNGLRARYGWSRGQRVTVPTGDPPAQLAALLHRWPAEDARARKAVQTTRQAALLDAVRAATREQPKNRNLKALVVAPDAAASVRAIRPAVRDVTAVELDTARVKSTSAAYPDARVLPLESHLRLPVAPDEFDVAVASITGRMPTPHRRWRLVEELWRAVRPGGRLVFLEPFVATEGGDGRRVAGIHRFLGFVADATQRRITLEDVHALRYPGEDVHTDGVLTLTKIGLSAAL